MKLPGKAQPVAPPDLGADWSTSVDGSGRSVTLTRGGTVMRITRAAVSPLSAVYPVGSTDLVVDVQGDAAALRELVPAVWSADPACRRVVVPVADGDDALASAARGAGLLGVLEAQLPDGRDVRLFVAEPESVRAEAHDISDMPE